MGFFSFNNEFEMVVNHPKEIVYEKFISYIQRKNWEVVSSIQTEKITFQTSPTLVSFSMDFSVIFTAIDEKSTKLSVSFSAGNLDCGRSKGVINDILKESFGGIGNGAELQRNEHSSTAKGKNLFDFDTSSYKSWSKLAIIVSIVLVIVLSIFPSTSYYEEDEYWDETYEEDAYEYEAYEEYEYETTETSKQQTTNQPSWLIGSWRVPIGDTGVLIVDLYRNDASVKIMRGFTVVSDIQYDNWTVFDDMLYLILDGEKLKDSPSFYVDSYNHVILGHTGERFQKH